MRLISFYWQHRLDTLLHSDFWVVETSLWLHKLARALVAVFIPILLLQHGFSIGSVLLWFLIYNLLDVPFNFVARFLVRRIGAIAVTIIAKILLIAFFVLFSFIGPESWLILFAAALLHAMYDAFYWVAHLYLFLESDKRAQRARRGVNILRAGKAIASLVAPAVGAILLTFSTDTVLLYTATVLMALSIIPLFFAHHITDRPDYPQLGIREFFAHPRERKNYFTTAFYSLHGDAEAVIMPIVIFLLFENVASVAAIPIAVALTAIGFAAFTNRIPPARYQRLIIVGAFSIAVIWIARLFLESPGAFYTTFVLVGIFNLFIINPLDSDLFARAKAIDPLSAVTYRNATYMAIHALFYGILLFFVEVLQVSFIFAALGMLAIIMLHLLFFRTESDASEKHAVAAVPRS